MIYSITALFSNNITYHSMAWASPHTKTIILTVCKSSASFWGPPPSIVWGGGKSEEGVSRSVSSSSSSSFSRHTLSPSVSKTPSDRKDGHWTFGPQQEEIQQLFPAYNIDKQKNEHLAVHLAGQLGKCLGVLVESLSNSPSHLSLTDGQTDVQTTAVATCYGRVFVAVAVRHPFGFSLRLLDLHSSVLSGGGLSVISRTRARERRRSLIKIRKSFLYVGENGQMFHIAKVLSSNDFCHF